jgi:hypothetical protein
MSEDADGNVVQLGAFRPKSKSVSKTRKQSCRRSESSLAWFQAFGARLRATRLTLGISEAEAAAG